MKSRQLVAAVLLTFVSVCSGRFADVNHLHPGAGWGLINYSENGRFAAVLLRPADVNGCVLEVYDLNTPENSLLWKADASWKASRTTMFPSNDGKYIVILDKRKEAPGDALEFYARDKGKIEGYSRQEVLSVCQALTGNTREDILPSFHIFHNWEGDTYFCGCMLGKEELHWVCWSAASGDHVEIHKRLVARITEHARQHFRRELALEQRYYTKLLAWLFLARLKRSEDRALLEKFLTDQDFVTNPIWLQKPSFLREFFHQINIETEPRY
ncbi:MAG: hypothetical protein ACYST6_18100, partial [Planctomycetota bacterium]